MCVRARTVVGALGADLEGDGAGDEVAQEHRHGQGGHLIVMGCDVVGWIYVGMYEAAVGGVCVLVIVFLKSPCWGPWC